MNNSVLSLAAISLLLNGGVLSISAAAAADSAGTSSSAARHWTADNGNGTYSNPLFYEEFEDPDPIRVGDDYYLAGTTMHMNPAVQLMHSKDLVNWELAGYCADKLDLGPAYRLEGGNIYGRGIWAPCIRYHDGMFYVFSNVNGAALQVFRSKSINGPWEHNQLPGRHDMSVLFDDDGKIYIISGNSSPYPIDEIAPDLKSFVPGVHHQLAVPQGQRMGEGHHLYKIKGKYYDVSAIPGGAVNQMVAKADSIDGPWTVTTMVDGESLGVTARGACACQRQRPRRVAAPGRHVRYPFGRMVEHHHVGPRQRRPHGFPGSRSPGTTASRSSACRAICAKRPIPGSSPTPAIRRNPSRRSSMTTTSTAASSIRFGSGTTSPMTPNGPSRRSPACCASIPCPPRDFLSAPATASASGRPDPNPS